ncbi:MAG: thymidine kinase [Clostridiales bacterium]|nr:thymidine kinase [Clostridiales bacterium]
MSKLYFKYGTMGSSKTALALMTKFNYEQKGFNVKLIKPSLDTRDVKDGKIVVKSRIGLFADCFTFTKRDNLYDFIKKFNINEKSVIIVDECQFCTKEQIEQLQKISRKNQVLCYGLLTNFKSELFEGSKRLVEIADSLQEIKSVCKCGKKANINARFINGKLVTEGAEIMVGAEESYESLCFNCYNKLLEK